MIEIRDLIKKFNDHYVFNNLNLDIESDKITVILGKSGCGKTTLLRLISNLEKYDSGSINTNNLKFSYVFQEPRLFPWLTVFENIQAITNLPSDEIYRMIRMVDLEKFSNSYPDELSGGMKSRVSLARAFAYKPNFLLMDEPFSSLDDFTRVKMQEELLKLYNKENVGILFVTHNIDEALTIADKIIVLKEGKIYSSYNINSKKRDLLDFEFTTLKRKIRDDIWRIQ
ncbi:ABC transporter ATP-binding protein [Sneathia sp. DSM 16631]|uniref:ABC transporter ATP-binding protein n=1 Tax=Sneathia TaxID=168808 RepID=UPI0018677225|nr:MULTISPECIES: ABC transporter ATP-binding protein [Sneathia]MBE3031490.1 ABC transporter ATP-binding protein [Sneathia sp. DSM 16631]MDK9582389.1 ABC transporter ATP-binding protein [Sneathia vaginalis]